MNSFRIPQKRNANKFASTNTTNEIVDVLASLGPVISFGADEKPLAPFPERARVIIDSAKTKGAVYGGFIWVPLTTTINAGAAGALATTDIGSQGRAIYIVNLPEVGQDTHDLTDGTPNAVLFSAQIASYGASDGTAVYEINGYDWKDCA